MHDFEIKQLQRRITLLAVIGVLVTALVVGLAAGVPQYQQARQQLEQTLAHNVEIQGLAVEQLLAKWHDVASQITSRTRIRQELEAYNSGERTLEELQQFSDPKLDDALSYTPEAKALVRLDALGNPVITIGRPVPQELIPELPQSAKVPEDTGPLNIGGDQYMLVLAPILNRHGERVGTDVVAYSLEPLAAILIELNTKFPSAHAYLGHHDSRWVLAHGEGHNAIEMLAETEAHGFMMSSFEGKQVFAETVEGRTTFSVPIGETRWALTVSLDSSSFYSNALHSIGASLVVMLIGMGLAAVVTARQIGKLAHRTVGRANELADTAAEQGLILAHARDFVYRLDESGQYIFVSPSVHRVTGFSVDTWLNQPPIVLGLAAEDGVPYQVTMRHYDGNELILEINEQAYVDERGHRGCVGIARDVSERIRAERELERSKRQWNYALEYSDDGIALVDTSDCLINSNLAFRQIIGRQFDLTQNLPLHQILHPEDGGANCPVCTARKNKQPLKTVLEQDHPANRYGMPLEVVIKPITDRSNNITGVLMGVHDLTHSREIQNELLLAESVFASADELIAITDAEHRVLRANTAFAEAFHVRYSDLLNRDLREVLKGSNHHDGSLGVWEALKHGESWQGEENYFLDNGDIFSGWHRASVQRDNRGDVLHYIHILTDITAEKRSQAEIEHLANYDPLTELPNRSLFLQRVDSSIRNAANSEGRVAVLLLDLDRFKNINDTLGHEAGDHLLKTIAQRIGEQVESHHTLARLGGDEFGVVFEYRRDLAEVIDLSEGLLAQVSNPVSLGGRELFIGASIGISIYPNDGTERNELMQHADTAMFRAKERGRNSYEFYSPEMTAETSSRLHLENDLRRAIEREELVIYYQPQLSLVTGDIIGVEALLRWRHAERGLIPPFEFIPLAEDTGLIIPIGEWVMKRACEDVLSWCKAGEQPLRLAVNVAGPQIVDGDIAATTQRVLDSTRFPVEQLELEITESFVMSHVTEGVEVLNHFKELGVTLAIDDFGTGYSSLAHLKRMPVDRLKIDRSFVKDTPQDRDDVAIVETIIAMAQHLKLDVLAEGVETEAQRAFLASAGCGEFQGFLVSPPVPADELKTMLDK